MKIIPDLRKRPYTIWIHILVWTAYFLFPMLFIESAQGRIRYLQYGWATQFLMVLYFYYNYFFLIPKYFLRKRTLIYTLLLILGFVVVCALNAGYGYFMYQMKEHHNHPFSVWRYVFFPFYPMIMAFAVSTAVRITMEWFGNERQKKEMEAEKLSSELAFLKSQVNPHFLFNILNNICSLARKKSDETENAIIKLSQIMRYMLQDSKDEKVSLEKEVDYLRSYIELQRLRLPAKVKVDFAIEGFPHRHTIEPLLLIPFVENAFKHGITCNDASVIAIRLATSDEELRFCVSNMIARQGIESSGLGSGIGLKNVTRRLELLYPERHHLNIRDDGKTYEVELSISFIS